MDQRQVRVLLIEDNPADAKLTSLMLSAAKTTSFHLDICDRLSLGLGRISKGDIDVLLLDLGLPDSQGFATFERAHAVEPSLPVVLLSGLQDEEVAIRAVSVGAQDYLIKGQVESDTLVRTVLFAIERQRKQLAAAPKSNGKILAFFGSKGGVGTTTLALNVATGIAEAHKGVIAVELRADFGTFSLQLGHTPGHDLGDLLELAGDRIGRDEVASRLMEFPWRLKVLFGPQKFRDFRLIEPDKAEALLDHLVQLADYVVLDLPDGWSPASRIAARRCQTGIVVFDNHPVSFSCGKLVLEQLSAAGASHPLLHATLVNRSGALFGLQMSELNIKLGCDILQVIPPAAELCLRSQEAHKPFILVDPESIPSVAVYELVHKLLAQGNLSPSTRPVWSDSVR
jgi:MinD-like ATPase involved in chromosome partitioning or flagellar assembly/FixJ family two-component response regulator